MAFSSHQKFKCNEKDITNYKRPPHESSERVQEKYDLVLLVWILFCLCLVLLLPRLAIIYLIDMETN